MESVSYVISDLNDRRWFEEFGFRPHRPSFGLGTVSLAGTVAVQLTSLKLLMTDTAYQFLTGIQNSAT